MNAESPADPSAPPSPKPKTRRNLGCLIVLVTLGLMASGVVAVAVTAYQALRLGPDARDLRDAVQQHFEKDGGSWHPVVEVRLGSILCGIGRQIAIHAADDPDATAALRAVRAVQCGVYQVDPDRGAAEFLRDATDAMSARGWSRVVAVVDGSTSVAVFAPQGIGTADEFEIGVVVHEDDTVVIAIGRARTAPLLGLVQRHMRRHRGTSTVER
jgi:hypothetical protein